MSVNLRLTIEVRNYDLARGDAITKAIAGIIEQEGLGFDFGQFERMRDAGGKPLLRTRTNPQTPVIVSRSYVWIPEMEKRLESAVREANGGACDVRFYGDDADAGPPASGPSYSSEWRSLADPDGSDKAAPSPVSRVNRPAVKPSQLHEQPLELKRMLEERLAALEEKLAEPGLAKVSRLERIIDIANDALEHYSVIERNDPVIHVAVRAIAQSATGVLLLSGDSQGREVEIPIGDRKISRASVGPYYRADISCWTKGWYAALMARDEECLRLLSGISDDAMRAASTMPSYHYSWKAALIAFRSDPESASPHIESAIKLSQPEHAQRAHPAKAAADRAMFPMLSSLARLDAAAFNERLAGSLKAHRNCWKSKQWVAQGPLALCCLAHDIGIPIEVESDYLLPSLINRSFA